MRASRADDAAPAAPAKDPEIPADTEIVTTASGLKYSVLVPGKEGKHPKMGESVKVHYTGWLTDGTKFDSSRDRGAPTEFMVGQVIPGWNEALQLMTTGARWKLTIPAKLAYGESGSPPKIPANATLIFDVELLAFRSMPDFHAPDPAVQKKTASGLKYEVLAEGAGDPPGANDAVELKFAFWTTKGGLCDCTEKAGQTVKARAEDLALPFMKEAIGLLRPGARLRFEVPPELCFGDKPMSAELPANSPTIWELELVRVIHPLPLPKFALPDDAKAKTTASGLSTR
jgi:FK506-binding protein 4/5